MIETLSNDTLLVIDRTVAFEVALRLTKSRPNLPKTHHGPILPIDRILQRRLDRADFFLELFVIDRIFTHLGSPFGTILPVSH